MLTLFRRHLKECKWKTRKHRNCQCPLMVEGKLHGRMIRKSLDIRDWEANPVGTMMMKEACQRFDEDAVARGI